MKFSRAFKGKCQIMGKLRDSWQLKNVLFIVGGEVNETYVKAGVVVGTGRRRGLKLE